MIRNDGEIRLDIVLKTMAKNKIYIFGAGASKEFGYPLGNEFSHYAFRVKEFENLAHSEYAQHVKHLLPKITKFLNILYPNLPIKRKRRQANYAKHPQMGSGLDMGHFCGDLVDDFPKRSVFV